MTVQVEVELIQENQAEGYSVSRLGNLPLVVPFGARLTADQADRVVWAGGELAKGRSEAALAALARIQRDLGVTQDLHQAAVAAAGAALAAKVRQARKAARTAQAQRLEASPAPAVLEPNGSVNFNAEEADKARARLRTAQVQVERARANGKRDQGALNARKAALADLRKYEGRAAKAREDQRDHAWAETARAETLALAQARGEDVTVEASEAGPGRLRIKSRDGLRALYEAERLTQQELDWGLTFRACFEAAHASKVASGLAMLGGGKAASSDAAIAAQARNLRLMVDLTEIERAVSVDKRGPYRLRVLREIAGQGLCIRELASGGDGRARVKALLLEALHLVPVGLEAARERLANQGQ